MHIHICVCACPFGYVPMNLRMSSQENPLWLSHHRHPASIWNHNSFCFLDNSGREK